MRLPFGKKRVPAEEELQTQAESLAPQDDPAVPDSQLVPPDGPGSADVPDWQDAPASSAPPNGETTGDAADRLSIADSEESTEVPSSLAEEESAAGPTGKASGDAAADSAKPAKRAASKATTKARESRDSTDPSRRVPVALLGNRLGGKSIASLWKGSSVSRVAIIVVLMYAACTSSMYLFVLKPTGNHLQEVKEQKSLLHDYAVIQEAGAVVGRFKDGLMTGDQRLTVLSEIRLMAEGAGVRLVGDPELLVPRDASKLIAEYPARLRVKGTYHEVGEFIALLEASPRFIIVEEVEILSEPASRSRESETTILLALSSWEG